MIRSKIAQLSGEHNLPCYSMQLALGMLERLEVGVNDRVSLQLLVIEIDYKPSNVPSEVRLFGVVSDGYNTRAVRFHERLLPLVQKGLLSHLTTFLAHMSKRRSHMHDVTFIPHVSFLVPRSAVFGTPHIACSL